MNAGRFARLKRALERRQPDLTVLMDQVNKSHNFSAILRNCDAAGGARGTRRASGGRPRPPPSHFCRDQEVGAGPTASMRTGGFRAFEGAGDAPCGGAPW